MDLFIALLPALIMITMVIITRKVILSLAVGIIIAAFIVSDYNVINSIIYIFVNLYEILIDYTWYLPILAFVVIIGGITAVLTLTGGIRAFALWSVSRIKNRMLAQFVTFILGILIMFDDYFNVLVIGEVSKPITDQHKVSRAKLAYIIDSTSAPVVIMMPFSTWGAYIIGSIGGLLVTSSITQTGLFVFISAIPYQFYPITALILVFLVILFDIQAGPMKRMEKSALAGHDISKIEASDVVEKIEGKRASHFQLILTVLTLLIFTFLTMLHMAEYDFSLLMEQEITIPLFVGGVMGLIVALLFAFLDRNIKRKSIITATYKGILEMAKSAVIILVLAWMVAIAIDDLGTGVLIAEVVSSLEISTALIPLILFLISGFIAFSTGTSWGAFGILLPIAIPIAAATDVTFLPAMIAATLGGAVFGDHSSPISDTTVLSSTGARSTVHAHFISQLPYVLFAAITAALGYLVYGLTHQLWLGYIVIFAIIGAALFVFKLLTRRSVT